MLSESEWVRLAMGAELETQAAPSHSVLTTAGWPSVMPFAVLGTLDGDAGSENQSQGRFRAKESLMRQVLQREQLLGPKSSFQVASVLKRCC